MFRHVPAISRHFPPFTANFYRSFTFRDFASQSYRLENY